MEKEWKNIGFQLYKELKGEEDFNKQMAELNKDPPPPGIFSKVQLRANVIKFEAAFGLKAALTHKRATHAKGFGAIGQVTVVKHPKFPDHDFFTAGRVFPVRLRHANLRFEDDAMADFRSASLKFADNDKESPLDIIMSTGRVGIFVSTQSVWDPLKSASGKFSFKDYLLLNPVYLHTNIEGIRRAPDSCTDQIYHSQIASNFTAKDGKARYVKYRLKNSEGRKETGLLTEQEQRNVWNRDRYTDDKRCQNYLKKEFESRLSEGPIHYKLQIQLHEVTSNDSPHILNASRAWNEQTHPWIDLADVSISTILADEVIERTRYSISNSPPSLSMVGPPESIYDFRCISYYRQRVYKRSQKMRLLSSPHHHNDNTCMYVIQIETGEAKHAGTDATITLTMTGSKGRTDYICLDKILHNDFERGSIENYEITTLDVGDLYVIHLYNDRGGALLKNPDWFVNKVSIFKEGLDEPYEFPCYSWVSKKLVAFYGAGVLPHKKQPEIVLIERQVQIAERQEEYKWLSDMDKTPDFPGCINAKEHDDIPLNSRFSDPSSRSFNAGRINAIMNLGLSYLTTLTESWDSFEDFTKMFSSWVVQERPRYAEKEVWMDDAVFGMQFLNGVNPMMIERCTKLPTNFPVTQAMVGNLLDRGLTLEKEMKEGHIYIANYHILEGISRNGNGSVNARHITEPLLLLYVNNRGDLVPIAIQLFQKPGIENPIWTPNDEKLDWLFVKMWVRAADLQIHQMLSHLLNTHLIMEVFAVATWRNLPSIHPVFKLLFPHIRSIMAINTLGRKELISKGGIADVTLSIGGGGHIELIQKQYQRFTWDMIDIPTNLQKRGINDPEKLPNFYYRDDALRLWQEIGIFIRDIVELYYTSHEDVVRDQEIQAWVKDIHENGLSTSEGHVDHKFPNSLASRDDLIHLLTCVVFTCSCQHAAVNFSQLEVYAFIPNAPPSMQLPPPKRKGETTMKRIMNTLPSKWQTAWHIGTMHTLTRIAEDEKLIGDFSDGLFVDPKALDIIAKFQSNLQQISDVIKLRNKTSEWPYVYLLPERIPNSVAI